ncbi:MAG: HEAT repeat domain-containing protein, partial [Gemmataceae bacterium]
GSYSNEATTCFAILFLKKTNFVSDLSRALKGKVKDPGAAELRGSRGGPLGLNAAGSASAVRSPTAGGAPGAALPPGVTAVGMNPAEAIAEELVVVPEAEWLTKLRVTKESKGAQFTLGIAMAIGRLDGKRQYQCREALAERLTRLAPETLKRLLADRDSELRRAACLAIGMKDDKKQIRELIERVTDIDESVIRAAKASLKSMTDQNFGPPPKASDDEKQKAMDQWLIWYAAEGRGK